MSFAPSTTPSIPFVLAPSTAPIIPAPSTAPVVVRTPSTAPVVVRTPSTAPVVVPAPVISNTSSSNFSLDFIFAYVYPVSFLGAMFYGISSILSFDPSTVIANKNVSVFINGFVGLSGLIGIFNWFQSNQIPIIGNIILPNGTGIIKVQAA